MMKVAVLGSLLALASVACQSSKKEVGGIEPRKMTDAIYAVISADRTVYTRDVVNRLQNEKVIKATEHFKDEKMLPLPAQMLRMGAEIVQKADAGFTYALLSDWPINRQNAPVTEVEKLGLKQVATSQKPYYADEKLGEKRYFTAVYPDKAVAEACVTCHNDNPDSPRSDFKLGDVMGGVVVRIPID